MGLIQKESDQLADSVCHIKLPHFVARNELFYLAILKDGRVKFFVLNFVLSTEISICDRPDVFKPKS